MHRLILQCVLRFAETAMVGGESLRFSTVSYRVAPRVSSSLSDRRREV